MSCPYRLFKMQPIAVESRRTLERQRVLPTGHTAATDQNGQEVVLCPDGAVVWQNTFEAEQRRERESQPTREGHQESPRDGRSGAWPDDMR